MVDPEMNLRSPRRAGWRRSGSSDRTAAWQRL
jgi:hypothetical protein